MIEYQIFNYLPQNSQIIIDKNEFSLSKFCPRKNKGYYIVDEEFVFDDSVLDDDYDSYEDNYYVKYYADNLIYVISHNLYTNIEEREKMINALTKKIEIFIMRMVKIYNKGQYKNSVLRFLKVLLALNKDEEFINIVNKYYIELEKEINKNSDIFNMYNDAIHLDSVELYQKAGDRALLLKNDYQLALKFYKLCTLNWNKFSNKNYTPRSVGKNYEIWIECMNDFFDGKTINVPRRHYLNNTNIKRMFETYNNAISVINDSEECRDSVLLFNSFVKENIEYLNTNPEIHYFRTYMLLMYSLKEKCMIGSLYSLSNEVETIQNEYLEYVFDTVKNMKMKQMKILNTFINNKLKGDKKQTFQELLLLAKSIYCNDLLQKYLLVDKSNNEMAYYTSLDNFFFMLPSKCKKAEDIGKLSIMNISYMNDPNEGKMLLNYLNLNMQQKDEERRDIRIPYVFLKSFTSQIDYLPMWEMYSNHSQGCCIVIDWQSTKEYSMQGNVPLYQVLYIENNNGRLDIKEEHNRHIRNFKKAKYQLEILQGISNQLYSLLSKNLLKKIISNLQYLIKEASYSYEQEMRIIYSYPDLSDDFKHTQGDYPLLFVHPNFDLQIKEIILAPKFEDVSRKIPYIQEEVSKMCYHIGAKIPKISISNIDFR